MTANFLEHANTLLTDCVLLSV